MGNEPARNRSARFRPPRWRVVGLLAAVAALLAVPAPAGASARGKASPARPEASVGFWAGESVPGTDWNDPSSYWNRRSTRVYTRGLWKVLHRNRIPLYYGLRYERDFGPVPKGEPHRRDGLAIVRKANRLRVPVWAWVLIPYTDGYWAWEGAAVEQFNAVKSLTRWSEKKGVRLQGVVLDPESPLNTPFQTTATVLGGGDPNTLSSLFGGTVAPAVQCAAWHGYQRILSWGRRHHVKISAAPSASALDDVYDGSLALQDAANYIVPTGPWHELFFQAYRSLFSYYLGEDPGSGIIASYLRTARHWFGRGGQVTLGGAGRGKYKRLANLIHDVRLLATLGVSHVPIYSLEWTVRAYGGPRAVGLLARAAKEPLKGRERRKATSSLARANARRAAIRASDARTAAATPAITATFGAPQAPNSWPNACGA